MKAFDNFFDADDVSGSDIIMDRALPFVHSAKSRSAQDILKEKKLQKRPCGTFNEELVYFFYGRPAYRNADNELSSDDGLLPVVFIIEPAFVDITKVYPFDTGAFDMYRPTYLSNSSELSDYEMPNDLLRIQQYVKAMCGDGHKYFAGVYRDRSELPASIKTLCKMNHCLNDLVKLLTSEARDAIDDRSLTVEVITNGDVDISGKLLAVVAPEFYRGDRVLAEVVRDTGAKKYYYEYFRRHKVQDYVNDVFMKVKDYYYDYNYLERVS